MPRLLLVLAGLTVAAAEMGPPQPLGLTAKNINRRVLDAEYAVRGRLLDRARDLEKAGRSVVRCNIGNPQALGQRALGWVRAGISLCTNPELLEAVEAAHASSASLSDDAGGISGGGPLAELFAPDVVARAREYVDAIGSVGAYSDSQGVPIVREAVEMTCHIRFRPPNN